MNKLFKASVMAVAVLSAVGCARIQSGEVGLREKFDRTIDATELQPGSFNQTMIGNVLHFQVRSIAVQLDNRTPQTADNSTLKDFDLTAIYEINPVSVSELWTKQSRAFHATDDSGEHYLMFNYMSNIINSAAYKAVREYKALEVADNRGKIEQEIKRIATEALKEEKLETAITISQVQVRNALPSDDIVASANAVVRATNELKAKTVEVQTAQQEAQRLAMLAQNRANIDYMNARSLADIAEGVKNGKVNAIVVPYDFKGMISVGK
mgnify:FL=1